MDPEGIMLNEIMKTKTEHKTTHDIKVIEKEIIFTVTRGRGREQTGGRWATYTDFQS